MKKKPGDTPSATLNGVFKKQFIAKLQSNITKYPKMTSFADNNKPDTTEQKYMYI